MLDKPVALAWGAYKKERSPNAFFGMMRSRKFEDFLEQAMTIDASATALTFATVDGHIGFLVSGLVPKRNSIEDAIYIRDGTDKAQDWTGFIPAEELPRTIDPKEGYVVSCNNIVAPHTIKGMIGTTGTTTTRAIRAHKIIQEHIKNKQLFDANAIMKMQGDTVDEYARRMLPKLLAVVSRYQDSTFLPHRALNRTEKHVVAKLTQILANWDYDVAIESEGALVYNVWMTELKKMLLNAQFPDVTIRSLIVNMYAFNQFLSRQIVAWDQGRKLDSKHCVNILNDNMTLTCPYNVIYSLINAHEKIVAAMGSDEVLVGAKIGRRTGSGG